MSRSLPPKTFAFAGASALAVMLAFGCAREPGKPDPFPPAWNAEDHSFGRCVGTCAPDFGPREITQEECDRQENGLEFFPEPVWDWEQSTGVDNAYSYQDGTTEFLSTTTPTCSAETHAGLGSEISCQASYTPIPAPVDRCGSTEALHVRGGPFREWGGGLGRRLDGLAAAAALKIGSSCPSLSLESPDASTPAFCPKYVARIATAPGSVYVKPATATAPETTTTYPMNANGYYTMQVDLREWEGISFWARRGPDSQPGFRIALADLNLDDDSSFLETQGGLAPTCRRGKECGCRNHRACTRWPSGAVDKGGWLAGYYCAEPSLDLSPYEQWHPWNHELPYCGATQCDRENKAYPNSPDPTFFTSERTIDNYVGTASCNTFTFKNDTTYDYCFDEENGPTPPEGSERCGDPWFAPVRLSTDWAFYRVPFTELRQEGYGKEFPATKLSAITMVRFTWTVGWVDYWIDDVRFFRRK